MQSFIRELQRRNVVRVGGVYVVVGWVIVQIATTLEESMGLPVWFDGVVVALLLLGLPVALVLAWAFELTPEGVVRTEEVPEGESVTAATGRKLDYVILAGIAVLVAVTVLRGSGDAGAPVEPGSTATPGHVKQQMPEPAMSASPAPPPKSIAVLPFENRSPRSEDAFFADGVHDDLLTHLSKIADMHVISRTSVMSYAGSDRRIPEIGRELNVATVMEGAVQRAGNRVRINVQLIDADTDAHIWAEIYDRELTTDNIFDIQTEITRAIAAALDAALTTDDERELQNRPTQNLAAYDAYLNGRLQSIRYFAGDEIMLGAVASFDRAIELDPGFGEAYAGKAYAQIALYWYTAAGGDWLAAAAESLQRAQELAPDSVETLVARGYYHYWGHLDYEPADAAFDLALEKSPNHLLAIAGKSFVARRDGRFSEALTLMEMGRRIDPLNVDMHSSIVETLSGLGRFEEAIAALERANAAKEGALDPTVAAILWEHQGEAERGWQALWDSSDRASTVVWLYCGDFAVMTRDPDKIRRVLEEWPVDLRSPGHAPETYNLSRAKALLALGENDAARELLLDIRARLDASTNPYPEGWQANALYLPTELPGLLGDLEGVRAALADFEARHRPDAWAELRHLPMFARALIRAGDVEAGFDYVDQLVERRAPWVYLMFTIDPAFDTVRDHPRYRALKANYEAWAARN